MDRDTPAPPRRVQLMPLFRSRTQVGVLNLLLSRDAPLTISEMARRTGTSKPSVQAEVDRLEQAGIVSSVREGRNRLVRMTVTGSLRAAIETLVLHAAGPVTVIAQELARVDGVEEAFLYGSWAERYLGTPGAVPHDIDVLVIGSPDRDDVEDAADRARHRLGLDREVNATVVSRRSWGAGTSPFLRTVRERALVPLDLEASGEPS